MMMRQIGMRGRLGDGRGWRGGAAVAGALSASLAPDLPDPDMPHYSYTTKHSLLKITAFACFALNVKLHVVRYCVAEMMG